MIFKALFLSFFFLNTLFSEQKCEGKFVNPFTDICWGCIFPITIGGLKVSLDGEDTENPRRVICNCPKPPFIGIPISFWEPARLVDVTRTPYCMVSLGGFKIMGSGIKGRGSVEGGHTIAQGHSRMRQSFYQVHWYMYPITYILEILVDFLCLESGQIDLAYITELDPLWNDDETAFILNPEAVLFNNPIAQAACVADCTAATLSFPLDQMFWCSGCQGSMYPFTGTLNYHVGGVQASLLMVSRMIGKLHRELLLEITSGEAALCNRYRSVMIKKSQYKTQMVFPIPTASSKGCYPLGRTETIWGSSKEFPYQGEDFGYLIWRKRNCCML